MDWKEKYELSKACVDKIRNHLIDLKKSGIKPPHGFFYSKKTPTTLCFVNSDDCWSGISLHWNGSMRSLSTHAFTVKNSMHWKDCTILDIIDAHKQTNQTKPIEDMSGAEMLSVFAQALRMFKKNAKGSNKYIDEIIDVIIKSNNLDADGNKTGTHRTLSITTTKDGLLNDLEEDPIIWNNLSNIGSFQINSQKPVYWIGRNMGKEDGDPYDDTSIIRRIEHQVNLADRTF